jgi:hypothetical protein
MKKVMKRMCMAALLAIVSTAAMADETQVTVEFGEGFNVTVENEVTKGALTGGTIAVKSQAANATEATSTDVTITVTPAAGYYITKGDIKVYLTVPAGTRAIDIESPLTLSGDESLDKMAARDYTFTVPAGNGAIIYSADFKSADVLYQIGKENASDVTWSLAAGVLTITGTGATMDFDLGNEAFMDPFAAFRAAGSPVTSIIVEKEVTALGNNIFKNFVFKDFEGQPTLTILNSSDLMTLGTDAIPAGMAVEVPGNLYNAYKIAEGWSTLAETISYPTTGSVEMTGITFDTNNTYRAFVSTGQALIIPSVLKAYVISGLNESGTSLEIAEVKDQVIPAGVPVLLMAATTVSDGFITSTTTTAGTASGKYLKVAPTGGKPVSAGQVYLLHNNKFYFSQAGTIPANHVYLDLNEEQKQNASTRGVIGIGDDGTTGIQQIENGVNNEKTGWYTLDGRRLESAPTRKGLYINSGKKVIVK